VLALANREVISLPVLRKVSEWVAAGATLVGPKPVQASGLKDAAQADAEVQRLAEALWDAGKIVSDRTAREALQALGVKPDCEVEVPAGAAAAFDFIHRTDGDAEIYFVANRATNAVSARCTFRVAGKAPELWDAVGGACRLASAYEEKEGRITVPLDFSPCGSWLVVFRSQRPEVRGQRAEQTAAVPVLKVAGEWQVTFDPKWLGSEAGGQNTEGGVFTFETLQDWTLRSEPGIKHYSGTAIYRKTIELPPSVLRPQTLLYLDLGLVRELAEVRVNGTTCGTVWTPPFRVDITAAVKAGANEVEVRVVNFWYNRVFGDQSLSPDKRLTRTNIKKLQNPGTALMPSGLRGPVRVLSLERQ